MFDTLMKLDKDREVLDFYATDKRATKELLIRENFRTDHRRTGFRRLRGQKTGRAAGTVHPYAGRGLQSD